MSRPTARTVLFWMHLTAGVTAGAIILIMSVTGTLLMYERQMIAWSDREHRSTPTPGAERLSVEELLARVSADQPDVKPTAVTLASRPTAPVVIAAEGRSMLVDAYTGAWIADSGTRVRTAMAELRAWHRWLSVDDVDKRALPRAITGWSNAIFLFIVCSGLVLWLPRTWTWLRVRAVLWFQGGLRGKARDFNWHNTIGVWSMVPLFIVVLSAMPISFPWFTALVYRAVGDTPPAPPAAAAPAVPRAELRVAASVGASVTAVAQRAEAEAEPEPVSLAAIDRGIAAAQARVPDWTTINVRLVAGSAPYSFAIDRGDGGQPQLRSTLTVDRATGAEKYEAFSDQSPGRRLRSIMRFAHTGEVLGRFGQTVAGLATAGAVVLVWTGLSLSLRRARAFVGRRARVRGGTLIETDLVQPAKARSLAPARL